MSVRWGVAVAVVLALASSARGDEAHYRVTAAFAARVEVGEHSGLTIGLDVDERGPMLSVSQVVRPIERAPGFPLASAVATGDAGALEVPDDFELPAEARSAVLTSHSALDVLVGLVAFVSREVVLDENEKAPQDAFSVLARRRGRCSGRANLAVGLLRKAGIPARVVHGVLFEGEHPRWHRWGEAWLGSLGWVPFDPGASAGVVSVRYIPCSAVVPGLQPQGIVLERMAGGSFDSLPRRSGLATPPVHGVNLTCKAPEGVTDITAILVGPDGMRWVRRGESSVAFDALQPGSYWLTWRTGDLIVSPVRVDLRRHGDVSIVLATGTLADAADSDADGYATAGGSDS